MRKRFIKKENVYFINPKPFLRKKPYVSLFSYGILVIIGLTFVALGVLVGLMK